MRIAKLAGSLLTAGILVATNGGMAAPSDGTSALTKLESRQLPPNVVTNRALEALSRRLRLEPYPTGGPPPQLPLSDLWFRTDAYATYLPGLCAYDEVTIDFRPTQPGKFDAATNTTPYHIESKSFYRFIGEDSRAPTMELGLNDIVKADSACAKLAPGKDIALAAIDEVTAFEAIQVVDELARQLSHKPFSFELACDQYGVSCEKDVGKISSSNMTDVQSCDPVPVGNASARCWDMFFPAGELGLKVYAMKAGLTWKLYRVIPSMIVTTGDSRAD